MTTSWAERSVENVCVRVTSGGTPSRKLPEYFRGTIPWLKTQELFDTWVNDAEEHITEEAVQGSSAKLLPERTVLMAMYGATAGKLAILGREMTCNQAACAMVADPSTADYRFLFYRLLNDRPRLVDLANGAAQQNLSAATIKALTYQFPPIEEQRGIAATLGALDDKIESNRRIISTALHLAQVEAHRVTGSRELVPFVSAYSVKAGSAFKGRHFTAPGRGRPLLRIRDLKTFEPQVWTAEERDDEVLIAPGDIVVGMDAEFRAVLWLGTTAVLNQRVCTFRPKPGVSRAFVLTTLGPELSSQESAKTGTTVIHLNLGDIQRFCIPRLTTSEHGSLRLRTEPLVDVAVQRAHENRTLAALRDALLPELLSGRIRVPEASGAVAEATA